jgi:hypothetical protein
MAWKTIARGKTPPELMAKPGDRFKIIYRGIDLQYIPESVVLWGVRRGYDNDQTARVDNVSVIARNGTDNTYDVAVELTVLGAAGGSLHKGAVIPVVSIALILGGLALSAYVLGILNETLDEVQQFTEIEVGPVKVNVAGLIALGVIGLIGFKMWRNV